MVSDDQLDTDGDGHYFLPIVRGEPVTPVTAVTVLGDSGDMSDSRSREAS